MKNIKNQSAKLTSREIPTGLAGMVRKFRPATDPGQIPYSATIQSDLDSIRQKITPGKNLICLFSGSSVTGKTTAAGQLARQLGRDLYRIDLSAVMSKYIGETEKNLSRLFDTSGSRDAILYFDEADALFGKRTEVKDSHDRYANIETSYLLQLIQNYPGLVILSSGKKQAIDPAFLRCVDCTIDFRRTPRKSK